MHVEFINSKGNVAEITLYLVSRQGIGRSRGCKRDVHPSGPKFLNFIHVVFGKNWSNSRLAPP